MGFGWLASYSMVPAYFQSQLHDRHNLFGCKSGILTATVRALFLLTTNVRDIFSLASNKLVLAEDPETWWLLKCSSGVKLLRKADLVACMFFFSCPAHFFYTTSLSVHKDLHNSIIWCVGLTIEELMAAEMEGGHLTFCTMVQMGGHKLSANV